MDADLLTALRELSETWRKGASLAKLFADANPQEPAYQQRQLTVSRCFQECADDLDALLAQIEGPSDAQMNCGFCLYGPPAVCTCGECDSAEYDKPVSGKVSR